MCLSNRVNVDNRDNGILEADFANTGVLVDPAEDLLLPDEAVLRRGDPAEVVSTFTEEKSRE